MTEHSERSTGVGKMLFVGDSAVENRGSPDRADIGELPDPVDIGGLPDEILLKIFSYLSLTDLAWSSHTCRRWNNILKLKKSLWERKECSTSSTGNIQEVLAVAGAIPQLKTLYLTYSREFRIDIAWPEAMVYHHYGDAPLTWEPYFNAFDTECLVLDHSMQKNVFFYLSWVDCHNVTRIVVLEHPHMDNHHIPSSSLINHMSILPGCSQNSSDTPRVLGQKCSSQSEGSTSMATTSQQHSKYRRIVNQDKVLAVEPEEENRICPSLEEVNVFSKYIWDQHLENLCSLGPLRILCVECQRLHSLTFVRCCSSSLEVLIITDCRFLLEDAFVELSVLKNLRVLQLSNCRIKESTVRTYADTLPHLKSFLFNGREAH